MPSPDNNALAEEAREMSTEERPYLKIKSKTRHVRRAVYTIFHMTPEERKIFRPRTGFEEAALNLMEACLSKKPYSTVALAMKSVQSILGEENRGGGSSEDKRPTVQILDDMPRANRTRTPYPIEYKEDPRIKKTPPEEKVKIEEEMPPNLTELEQRQWKMRQRYS